ncbi:MAG: DUF6496 domain-containing protein, partial [Alphaproteobacteria bacterium]
VRGYMRGGACGYAKGGAAKAAPVGAVKIGVVMKEFGKGKLHSGSDKGPLVKNPKQALAIGISEARKAGAKMPVKKAMGGLMSAPGAGAISDKEMQKLKKVAMPIIGKILANPALPQVIGRNFNPDAAKMAGARGAALSAAGLGAITNREAAGMAARGAAGPAAGLGAITNAEAAKMAGARGAAGPTRAQFDATMAKRAAADAVLGKGYGAMTNAERNQISGGEGVAPMTGARFGRPYKKGGSTKC